MTDQAAKSSLDSGSARGGDPTWLDDGDRIEVPLSAIEHFSYCARQCALIHVEQVFDENIFTLRGRLAHERVHSDGADTGRLRVRSVRDMTLWSNRWGLYGKSDVVEFRPAPFPVEYKVGTVKAVHSRLQLCAQALCLEEMLDTEVPEGAIFHIRSHRREDVAFDASLREQTLAVVEAIRLQIGTQTVPEAPNDARCRHCSLRDACMPEVVANRDRLRGLQGALFRIE